MEKSKEHSKTLYYFPTSMQNRERKQINILAMFRLKRSKSKTNHPLKISGLFNQSVAESIEIASIKKAASTS